MQFHRKYEIITSLFHRVGTSLLWQLVFVQGFICAPIAKAHQAGLISWLSW